MEERAKSLSRISSEDKLVEKELERKRQKQNKKLIADAKKLSESRNRELKKQQKAEEKQAEKERKKISNEIVKSTVFFAVLFICMVGFYAYLISYDTEKIVNNSYNKRLKTYANKIIRGNIYNSDDEIIARTVVREDGSEYRDYPFGNIYAHVVGMDTVDRGKTGIEKMCDYYLLTTNANPILKIINEFKEKKNLGNDIITTLDSKLQKSSYESLGNNDGAVIVLDSKTGAILSMVSKPDYDPNNLDAIWEKIDNPDDSEGQGTNGNNGILLNRATQGLYTPGSVFKIFTALEYFRENNNDYDFYCDGKEEFANYVINCYNSTAHGNENLKDAFANSCNGAFAEIGTTLDLNKMSENMNKLFFNSNLPISLEYSKSVFDLNDDSSTFDITQTSIGQGKTLVTPIHMAMITQTIANDGITMKPYVVSSINGYDGSVITKYEPEQTEQVMTSEEAEKLQELMSAVTEYGTGSILSGASYESAGKTGTAQIDSKDNVNSWFVGYAKKDGKNISVCVVIENVPDGSVKAVECAKRIFDSYYE